MTLTTGQVLQNRYRIVSLLGQGGMGAVYRAWDTRLNVAVALKEMTHQPGLDPHTLAQLRQQFQQEAQVLALLSHPHLVRVTDFFQEGDNAYLVMNFVEGESLANRIQREGALPEGDVLAWANQLLDALAYCHSQEVIHRDVKPQNVIIRSDGQAVLVDFGLVKLWDPNNPRTQTVIQAMGTPEYAPPEQYDARMGHTDIRSDVYGLGATLYHALTGQTPPTATARIVDPTALVPVRVLRPGVSPHVEAAMARALQLQPDARFQSARKMKAALRKRTSITPPPRHIASAQVASGTSPTPGHRAIPWTWVGLIGAVVLAMVLVGGMMSGVALLFGDRGFFPPVIGSASATPTSEAVPGEVSVVTDTPTSVPISSPTITSFPTFTSHPTTVPRPTSTPWPTETPTPACPAVSGPFASIWQEVQERLGCVVNQSHTTWMAEEHFERGRMFWREDTDMMSVLYNSGKWALYQDIWHEGDPEYSCPDSAPAESPPTPIRGFGKVWCTYEPVRSGLGWATDQEHGYYVTVQDSERGSIIRTDDGTTYVLYGDGWWERW